MGYELKPLKLLLTSGIDAVQSQHFKHDAHHYQVGALSHHCANYLILLVTP